MPETDWGRVLVVDDEEIVREVLQTLLGKAGHHVHAVASAEEALTALGEHSYDLILLDFMLPGMGGFEALSRIKQMRPDQVVIIITAYGSIENAVEAMRLGAFDYVTKPFKNEEVLLVVRNAVRQRRLEEENRNLRRALRERHRFDRIVGKSKLMQELYRLVDQLAPSRSTVLIQGESGTGKELIAQAIHRKSSRVSKPFITVNSGSMPPDLLESNLFGHVRGAFTGAVQDKKGLFGAADGGSIFFDEISTLNPEVQAKLLRVIQEKEFIALGTVSSVRVDVRIIAATNIDLMELVQRGAFREDLYYRLNVINLRLPPLRTRKEDIPLLVDHFLEKYSQENHKRVERLTERAMQTLLDYAWPGNVRELENVLERAVVLSTVPVVDLDLLPATLLGGSAASPITALLSAEGQSLQEQLQGYERQLILRTLRHTQGVQKRAAELLRVKPTTLNEKIRRLGIHYAG
ncbi:MAG: sigma-54 dependent transcriptional regulator [Acidobacteriota bacterium]